MPNLKLFLTFRGEIADFLEIKFLKIIIFLLKNLNCIVDFNKCIYDKYILVLCFICVFACIKEFYVGVKKTPLYLLRLIISRRTNILHILDYSEP